MNSEKYRITVFTPIYNRRHTIHRAFESLCRQTFKGFEWLIIDDGSTDGVKELIDEYISSADFEVRYFRKENGGKHTAWNMALKLIKSDYFICLDSDDALTDNALERMLFHWDAIPEEKWGGYWSVAGLCVDSQTGEVVGDRYPEGINEAVSPRDVATTVNGEKFSCLRTEVMKDFPFPEPEGTTFITESIVWNSVDKSYMQFYVNDPYRIYYQHEPDSLTVAWYRDHVEEGYVSNYFWKVSTVNDAGGGLKTIFQAVYYGLTAKKSPSRIISDIKGKNKLAAALMIAPAFAAKALRGKKYIK
ncbi:MAG: glycosyltransferase [Clostridiales bacterium]|nr:glycosyltransferase [Clostridiales bacterium]